MTMTTVEGSERRLIEGVDQATDLIARSMLRMKQLRAPVSSREQRELFELAYKMAWLAERARAPALESEVDGWRASRRKAF